jgi:hypothetical protein
VADLDRPRFGDVHAEPEPGAALALAHQLGGRVLVTGSRYLLADRAGGDRKSVR